MLCAPVEVPARAAFWLKRASGCHRPGATVLPAPAEVIRPGCSSPGWTGVIKAAVRAWCRDRPGLLHLPPPPDPAQLATTDRPRLGRLTPNEASKIAGAAHPARRAGMRMMEAVAPGRAGASLLVRLPGARPRLPSPRRPGRFLPGHGDRRPAGRSPNRSTWRWWCWPVSSVPPAPAPASLPQTAYLFLDQQPC
jgi:hypothetical protein